MADGFTIANFRYVAHGLQEGRGAGQHRIALKQMLVDPEQSAAVGPAGATRFVSAARAQFGDKTEPSSRQ